jgi:crossover junction endodeoxyribonuclease RuvC
MVTSSSTHSTVKKPYVLGVDPGYTGALAIVHLETRRVIKCLDMPTLLVNGSKVVELTELSLFIDAHAPTLRLAAQEEVGARPGEDIGNAFRFGFGAGSVAGAISANYVPLYFVKPAIWKTLMCLSRDKKDSLVKARELFPADAHLFKRVKDHGRAEAALIAHFAADRLKF